MVDNVSVVIMAAGEGTRMKSKIPKVLHKVCGHGIIDYVIEAAAVISNSAPIVVLGHGSEEIKNSLPETCKFAYQHERLGTGHAVMMTEPFLKEVQGYVVVLAGDTPLITGDTLNRMVDYAVKGAYQAVALSAMLDNPTGYGRIVREQDGLFHSIVEHKDALGAQLAIKEVNASMYCFEAQSLLKALKQLKNDNAQGEYYLTDVLGILKGHGQKVGVYTIEDHSEIMGINTRVQLAEANTLMRARINTCHLLNGVTMLDHVQTYIDAGVTIGEDTIIYPNNVLEGNTTIGKSCTLYPNNRIVHGHIGNEVKLQASVVMESSIGDKVTIGPYAYIRPGSVIGESVKIGDFVEVKNSHIGKGTKVSHLTYIGDADLGEDINVGCGVVCVNYDGETKYRTTIGNNAFIGCNVNLVAPVEVEDEAYIAAGSTITEKVPSKALAIARARQVNKEGWVAQRRTQKTEEKHK